MIQSSDRLYVEDIYKFLMCSATARTLPIALLSIRGYLIDLSQQSCR